MCKKEKRNTFRRLKMNNNLYKHSVNRCSVCGNHYVGYGNNAQPVNEGRCCNDCNKSYVMPLRQLRYSLGLDMRIKNENEPNLIELMGIKEN